MKSITIIGENLGCGGTEKVIIKLIRYYEKKGYKTNIVLLSKAKVFERFSTSLICGIMSLLVFLFVINVN